MLQKQKADPPPEAWDLARLLQGEILAHKPDFRITERQVPSWAATADLMLRVDHRSAERIAAVIRWAQADTFWRANVLSMGTLREKFDALELRARGKGARGNGQITQERLDRELAIVRQRCTATGTGH